MTHRGPFKPLLFCDSVILWLLVQSTKSFTNQKEHRVARHYLSMRKNLKFLSRHSCFESILDFFFSLPISESWHFIATLIQTSHNYIRQCIMLLLIKKKNNFWFSVQVGSVQQDQIYNINKSTKTQDNISNQCNVLSLSYVLQTH